MAELNQDDTFMPLFGHGIWIKGQTDKGFTMDTVIERLKLDHWFSHWLGNSDALLDVNHYL